MKTRNLNVATMAILAATLTTVLVAGASADVYHHPYHRPVHHRVVHHVVMHRDVHPMNHHVDSRDAEHPH